MCFHPCPSGLGNSNSEEFTIFFNFKITSIYLLCVYMYICVPLSTCGGQRKACESWLSSCDTVGPQLVLLIWSCGFPRWNSGYQTCQQVLLNLLNHIIGPFCWICFWIFLLLYLFSFKARYNYWANCFSVDLNHSQPTELLLGPPNSHFWWRGFLSSDISTADGLGQFLHKTLNLLSVYFTISFFFVREIFKH